MSIVEGMWIYVTVYMLVVAIVALCFKWSE